MSSIPDDRLALVFTCCHPALAAESRVALTLREVAGLTTTQIARVPRPGADDGAAARAREAEGAGRRHPLPRPARPPSPDRLGSVLAVLYLVFNEGYSATGGGQAVRASLCDEAIRLAKLLAVLMLDEPEALGLLALMLLHDARREARRPTARSSCSRTRTGRWTRRIAGAHACSTGALAAAAGPLPAPGRDRRPPRRGGRTADRRALRRAGPARAVAGRGAEPRRRGRDGRGPERGLELLDRIDLPGYHLLHSTRADLLRRLARRDDAAAAYRAALALRDERRRPRLPRAPARGGDRLIRG